MGNRTPLIAGNWKMYKTTAEAVETARQLVDLTADVSDVDMMIAAIGVQRRFGHVADQVGAGLGAPLEVGTVSAAVTHHDDVLRCYLKVFGNFFGVGGLVRNFMQSIKYIRITVRSKGDFWMGR